EIYDRVASSAPGRPFSYELRDPFGGGHRTETIRSQVFGPRDYVYLFGAYLLNGLVFMAIGLLVVWLEPRAPASRGLAVAVLSTGVFVTTATDLYGPHWFFRLHVVAEAFMGAGFVHLALVF